MNKPDAQNGADPKDFIMSQPMQPAPDDPFGYYIDSVDEEMMRLYGVDTAGIDHVPSEEAGLSDALLDLLAHAQEDGWSPFDCAQHIGQKMNLRRLAESDFDKHLTGPWSGVTWHGKRISRSPTYRDRSEAEKWLRSQRKRFHPRHWMRSTLLHKGFLHQVNPNQRGTRLESAKKVVSMLLES